MRLATTARTPTDPRKYESGPLPGLPVLANVLTSLRITDVSPAAQDNAIRDAAGALTKEQGARSFESRYFSKDVIAQTREKDPEAARKMEAFMKLKKLLAKRARERKKAAQ